METFPPNPGSPKPILGAAFTAEKYDPAPPTAAVPRKEFKSSDGFTFDELVERRRIAEKVQREAYEHLQQKISELTPAQSALAVACHNVVREGVYMHRWMKQYEAQEAQPCQSCGCTPAEKNPGECPRCYAEDQLQLATAMPDCLAATFNVAHEYIGHLKGVSVSGADRIAAQAMVEALTKFLDGRS